MHRRFRLPAGAPLSWVLLTLALSAAPSRAGDTPAAPIEVRPFTPLRAALEQIAHDRGVPLAEVLADPARWLVGDVGTAGSGDVEHVGRQPSVATVGEDLPIRFAMPRLLGEQLRNPVVGDVDGNGIVDAAAQANPSGIVHVWEGDATHPLVTTHDVVLDAGDELQAMADVDRDGRADLVAARSADGSVAIYRALAAWTFAPAVRHGVGFEMLRVFAADVTGDGWPELVAAGPMVVRTLVNDGAGAFTPWVATAIANYSGPATFGDFDGDGRADAALRSSDGASATASLTLLHGTPDGTLAAWSILPTPGDDAVTDVRAGDLDGDGIADLVTGGNYAVRVWIGNGAGSFAGGAPHTLALHNADFRFQLGDFDRDGRRDVVAAARMDGCFAPNGSVLLLRGEASGALGSTGEWMATDPNNFGGVPTDLVQGDFDADGALDVFALFGAASGNLGVHMVNDGRGGFLAPAIQPFGQYPAPGAWRVDAVRVATGQPPAVALWDGSETWLGRGTGPSGFTRVERFAPGEMVCAVDLNADGLDDPIVARSDTTKVYLNLGGESFAPPIVSVGDTWLACADFDGANGPDLAVADADGHVRVRANDGTGHFGAPMDWGVVLEPEVSSVSGADLDRDGRAELLVGRNYFSTDDSVTIHWSTGSHFESGDSHRCGMIFDIGGPPHNATHPATMASGDFDGNGWPDLYVVNATRGDNPGSISIILGMGGRAFLPARDREVGPDPWMGVVADFDRDGLDDVAVVCDRDNINGSVFVFRADFGGVLQPMDQSPYGGVPAQHYPTSMALGDWDMDGRRDFVVGNVQGRTVGFYRNQSPLGLPTATLTSLVSASAGADGVRLEWFASDAGFDATLERALEPGAWEPLARVSADGTGRVTGRDADAPPGAHVGYRLAWSEAGALRHGGETWLDVPRADGPRLALAGARPHPARGAAVLVFTLPRAGDATLEVFDVAGRVVAREPLRAAAAGQHAHAVSRERALAPGLYLARLTQGEQHATARFVVAE